MLLLQRIPPALAGAPPSFEGGPAHGIALVPGAWQKGARMPKLKLRYYAVARGRLPGVYTDWETAFEQVRCCPRSLHKSFPTAAEAEDWLRQQTQTTASSPAAVFAPLAVHAPGCEGDEFPVCDQEARGLWTALEEAESARAPRPQAQAAAVRSRHFPGAPPAAGPPAFLRFEGEVLYAATAADAERAAVRLERALLCPELPCAVLGMDIEWRASFRKGKPNGPPATLQLATPALCAVFHLSAIGCVPPAVAALLRRSDVVKAGVGCAADAAKLELAFGARGLPAGLSAPVEPTQPAAAAAAGAGAVEAGSGSGAPAAARPQAEAGAEPSAARGCRPAVDGVVELGRWAAELAARDEPLRAALPGGSCSLSQLCRALLGAPLAKGSVRTSDWEAAPLSQAQLAYAALDAVAGARCFCALQALAPGQRPPVEARLHAGALAAAIPSARPLDQWLHAPRPAPGGVGACCDALDASFAQFAYAPEPAAAQPGRAAAQPAATLPSWRPCPRPSAALPPSKQMAAALFARGASLPEVAAARSIKQATALGYLLDAAEAGWPLDFARLQLPAVAEGAIRAAVRAEAARDPHGAAEPCAAAPEGGAHAAFARAPQPSAQPHAEPPKPERQPLAPLPGGAPATPPPAAPPAAPATDGPAAAAPESPLAPLCPANVAEWVRRVRRRLGPGVEFAHVRAVCAQLAASAPLLHVPAPPAV